MNKITTTAGLVALGAASFQYAAHAQLATSEATKPWSISAALRGFYDDNYTTSPKNVRRDTFGFEVSPSAAVNLVQDQTAIGLSYVYSLRYFEDRVRNRADHAHQFNAKLSHAFTPRYKIDLTDSFVIAQEPELMDPGAQRTFPLRTHGDNLRNHFTGSFSAGVTETTDLVFGYSNTYYDYEDDGRPNSYSALLDRMDHQASINLRQVILERTVGVAGYQFQFVDYLSDDGIGLGGLWPADIRDRFSHFMYVGVDQGITPTLNASVRVGAQYTVYNELDDYLPPGADDDTWGPYADANLTWTYLPGSYAQIGVRHQRISTDVAVFGFTSNNVLGVVPDAEATSIYGSVSQRIFGALVASVIAQYQHTHLENVGGNTDDENLFMAGVNLTYEINKWIAAEAGYNYDHLSSDLDDRGIGRSFTRNRVYVGVRATY